MKARIPALQIPLLSSIEIQDLTGVKNFFWWGKQNWHLTEKVVCTLDVQGRYEHKNFQPFQQAFMMMPAIKYLVFQIRHEKLNLICLGAWGGAFLTFAILELEGFIFAYETKKRESWEVSVYSDFAKTFACLKFVKGF